MNEPVLGYEGGLFHATITEDAGVITATKGAEILVIRDPAPDDSRAEAPASYRHDRQFVTMASGRRTLNIGVTLGVQPTDDDYNFFRENYESNTPVPLCFSTNVDDTKPHEEVYGMFTISSFSSSGNDDGVQEVSLQLRFAGMYHFVAPVVGP